MIKKNYTIPLMFTINNNTEFTNNIADIGPAIRFFGGYSE